MSEPALIDQAARARFRDEWDRNFAVSANAGSGKTTAISERLAALALAPDGERLLARTAVVTFTRKAAAQIGQRARQVLTRRLAETGRTDATPLDHLERAFFGTIHSFCLKLAQNYGRDLGINLNPKVVAESDGDEDDALWEEFLESAPMRFQSLATAELRAFLRHVPLEQVFALARGLDTGVARAFLARPPGPMPGPSRAALDQIESLVPKQKRSLPAVQANQRHAREWLRRFHEEDGFLAFAKPQGTAGGIKELFDAFHAPVKAWLADAAAVLAGELAERFRAWRFERGVQTYADQIDAAMAVLGDRATLDRIRAEGWRIILDEAQDTDPQQFAVLVEIARAPGARLGTWPDGGGEGPRNGHFCMVGDGQQAIYGGRADIVNFTRHLAAFERRDGGELLHFSVTFRAPHAVIDRLNATLPAAFGPGRAHNLGLPPEPGAPAPLLQVAYEPLAAGPGNARGRVARLPLTPPADASTNVGPLLAEEVRQIAVWLKRHGPAGVGAEHWGDICIIAPRNDWLLVARKTLETADLKVALQMRKNRNGDNPAYAWICGLLAVMADPDNLFEWSGVLREVFAVGDALIAAELRRHGTLHWDEPEQHPEPLAGALAAVRPLVLRFNDDGWPLELFATTLAAAAGLAAKARAVDSSGAVAAELQRLLSQAAELGLQGLGPRDWLKGLLEQRESGRPAGKPSAEAINLLTAHSAKGLEWPVVIPIGLWREIGKAPNLGLRIVNDRVAGARVYFDGASLPADLRESRERERLRETVRLLYVVLTRPRQALVLPWGEAFAAKLKECSFAGLWGGDLMDVPAVTVPAVPDSEAEDEAPSLTEPLPAVESAPLAVLNDADPAGGRLTTRVLPHQLAEHVPDLSRASRHESGLDQPSPVRLSDEAIDYGLWWHETMEFLPWDATGAEIDAFLARRLAVAAAMGVQPRAEDDLRRLRAGDAWVELTSPRWTRQAELGVLAPLAAGASWMDGVIDLVLHDPVAGEVWVLDWKTNRRRVGESDEAVLARLLAEYAPQLRAYGESMADFFPAARIRCLIYATVVGRWIEVGV
ncbi:MAG: UvrD-helicase domain-containing protein [Verrucomicrobiota bacterium]